VTPIERSRQRITDAKVYLRLLKIRSQLRPHMLQFKLDLEKRIVDETEKIERMQLCSS